MFFFPEKEPKICVPKCHLSPLASSALILIPHLNLPKALFLPAGNPPSPSPLANSFRSGEQSPFWEDHSVYFSKRSLKEVFAPGTSSQHSAMKSPTTSISKR